MSDKDQDGISLEEAEKKVKDLIETVLEKLSPARRIELTQRLAIKTVINSLSHLPSERIIHYLNRFAENIKLLSHDLETLRIEETQKESSINE